MTTEIDTELWADMPADGPHAQIPRTTSKPKRPSSAA